MRWPRGQFRAAPLNLRSDCSLRCRAGGGFVSAARFDPLTTITLVARLYSPTGSNHAAVFVSLPMRTRSAGLFDTDRLTPQQYDHPQPRATDLHNLRTEIALQRGHVTSNSVFITLAVLPPDTAPGLSIL